MKAALFPTKKSIQQRIILSGLMLLFIWIMVDIYIPIRSDIRIFDPAVVARLDAAMWRSYYERKPLVLFNQLAQMMRTQFRAPFFRSYVMAYQAARAAFVFKDGENRREYEKALPHLIDFYADIERMSSESFDVEKAAKLELEWWIIHRQRNMHKPGDLEKALAETASAIYRQPAWQFKEHAKLRAGAMHIRDTKAVNGGLRPSDWDEINRLLLDSWQSFQKAVSK